MPRIRATGLWIRDGKILLVRHTKNDRSYFLLPGGGVDEGESVPMALERELQEELGTKVKVGNLFLAAQSIAPDASRNILHMIFRVEGESEPFVTGEDERVTGLKWWCPEEGFLEKPFYPPVLERLLELVDDSTYNGVTFELPEWQD